MEGHGQPSRSPMRAAPGTPHLQTGGESQVKALGPSSPPALAHPGAHQLPGQPQRLCPQAGCWWAVMNSGPRREGLLPIVRWSTHRPTLLISTGLVFIECRLLVPSPDLAQGAQRWVRCGFWPWRNSWASGETPVEDSGMQLLLL